jgi:hypothetical protein
LTITALTAGSCRSITLFATPQNDKILLNVGALRQDSYSGAADMIGGLR